MAVRGKVQDLDAALSHRVLFRRRVDQVSMRLYVAGTRVRDAPN
jgi:hypothetical protein